MSPRRKRGAASTASEADATASDVDGPSTPKRSKTTASSTPLKETPSGLAKLLNKDLQAILAERGLDTKGRKADLIARIQEYDQQHQDDSDINQDANVAKDADVDVIDEAMTLSPAKRSASPSKAAKSPSLPRARLSTSPKKSPSKAERAPSPTKVLPGSPTAKRSPSPSKAERSPSPSNAERSPSPSKAERSPSPSKAERSPSPSKAERSPSPSKAERSPSPSKAERSPSPSKAERSPSPSKAERSPSPSKAERSPSPSKAERSPSPSKAERSPSPAKFKGLLSPMKTMEMEQRDMEPSPQAPPSVSPSASPDRRPKISPSRTSTPKQHRRSRSSSSESGIGAVMEVPGSPPGATFAIRIDNFVRPLRLDDVRDLVSKYGAVTDLTMDKFKTHAVVKYESRSEAAAALRALQGISFQPDSGKTLSISFVSSSPSPVSGSGASSVVGEPMAAVELGGGIPPPATDTITLDHIFKKTITLPPLYWIPNTTSS